MQERIYQYSENISDISNISIRYSQEMENILTKYKLHNAINLKRTKGLKYHFDIKSVWSI